MHCAAALLSVTCLPRGTQWTPQRYAHAHLFACVYTQAGLTLTEANTVFILEPSMDPGLEAQVAARVHRLGEAHVLVPVQQCT